MNFAEEKAKIEAIEKYKTIVKTLAENEGELAKAKKARTSNLIGLIFILPLGASYKFLSGSGYGLLGILFSMIPLICVIPVIFYIFKCKKLKKEIERNKIQLNEIDEEINRVNGQCGE